MKILHQHFSKAFRVFVSVGVLFLSSGQEIFAQGVQSASVQQTATEASVATSPLSAIPQTLHAPLFFLFVALIPILFLMLAEYSLVTTAHHKHDEIETSKKIILYSLIALVVIFFAFIIIDSTMVVLHQ